jgi:dTDP-4-dehydrorhamnose 3,5-epimerase
MHFTSLGGSDAQLIHLTLHADSRGSFARVWCADMFREAGIEFTPVQGNSSLTRARGAVRGMHFQRAPRADAKVVRCSSGRIHDVIIDLRPDSPTCGRSFSVELAAADARMLYIPGGFAHGFQTLTADTIVEYLMGEAYDAQLYDGARHDDPLLAVSWPLPIAEISDRDRSWPDLLPRMPWLQRRAA